MADADPQSSASAARTAAAEKLESELEAVKADIEKVNASIAEVKSTLGEMPAEERLSWVKIVAAREERLTVLEKRASDIRSEIKELRHAPTSREPTGASSLPHCRILRFPALLRHLQEWSFRIACRSLLFLGARTPVACVSPAAASSLFGLHAAALRVRVATKCLAAALVSRLLPSLAHPSVFLPTLAACVMLLCFKLTAQLLCAPTARVLLYKLALLCLVRCLCSTSVF